MTTKRWESMLISHEGYLYAIGGAEEHIEVALNSGERFDPKTQKWTPIANMTEKKCVYLIIYILYFISFKIINTILLNK